jgi:DNA polymerase III subunit gamma/tau
MRGSSIDVFELDAASHTQVDKIREAVIDTVNFAPVRDRCKVFIIDEVHMLSPHSFNALLKTLEEPPPHVVFILATTDFHKIPVTIVSRCQRFRFLPLTANQIFANLKAVAQAEKIAVADDALAVIARAAGGSVRDSLSIFDQIISHSASGAGIDRARVEDVLGAVREDFLVRFIGTIADKDARASLELSGKLLQEGHDLSHFLKELREAFRSMLAKKCGYADPEALSVAGAPLPDDRFSLEELLRGTQLLTRCAEQMRWNDLPHVVFESCVVRLCQESASAAELVKRLEDLERRLEGGGPAPEAPSRPEQARSKPERTEARTVAESRPDPAPEPAPQGTEAQATATDPVFGWRMALARLRQSKPSLSQALEQADVQGSADGLLVLLPTPFGLEMGRRNHALIQTALEEALGRKVALSWGLGKAKAADAPDPVSSAPVPESDPAVADAKGDEEELEAQEPLEPAEGAELRARDVVAEDEGTRRFLALFPGKLTKSTPNPA